MIVNPWRQKRYAISLVCHFPDRLDVSKSGKSNSVRIIGGDWRGRKLPVADVPGLRPTGDRARETLFNWLQPWVLAADCADLFAGTGALGFEAASRGAASVLMIEKHPLAASILQQSTETLQATQVTVHRGGAMRMLENFMPDVFDIVFVDPPFDSNLGGVVLERLDRLGCVRRGGFVYVETPASQVIAPPPGWSAWRDKQMGEVRMQLFRRISAADEINSGN
jgi:16S rRNA (guanine966-N2)-methyltransferase